MSPVRSALLLLAVLGLIGCGSENNAPKAVEAKPAPAQPAKVDEKTAPEGPRTRWSSLTHVAGRGETDIEGQNLWKPEFEGKPATEVELSRPYFAMADGAGHIYIADKEAHAVRRVELDGTIRTWAGTGEAGDDGDEPGPGRERRLNLPNGLWVLPSSMVFILDQGNGKVRRILPDGTMTTMITVEGGIDTGRGLWVAPDMNQAYMASKDRLLVWTPDGGTREAASGFSSLGNLLMEPAGTVLVCDRGGDRVFRLGTDGVLTPFAGTGRAGPLPPDGSEATATPMDGPRSVVRLEDGTILIASHEGGRLWEIRDGKAWRVYDPDPGQEPAFDLGGERPLAIRGLSLMPSGDLLLVHANEGRVHRLQADRG